MFSVFFYLFFLIPFFWLIRTIKACLFWLYLWQLKEYHIGRFLAHFHTEKGKRLFLNKLFFLKIILFFVLLGLGYISVEPGFWDTIVDFSFFAFIFLLFAIYSLEAFKTVKDYFSNKLVKPISTVKIRFLFLIILVFTIGFLFFDLFYYRGPLVGLLLFDLLLPVVVSAVVFVFQPITVLIRNRIIKKAKEKRAKFKNLLVIGITGSYGKTSTKEILATILSERFNVLKTKEHQNSEIGISQCILNDLEQKHQIFICEMGAYSRGGIKFLCDIAQPKIGILTGINEQHLATFGSQETIIKTKFELIESLPLNGTAFFNGKNKYCLELFQKTPLKKILYGKETDSADTENITGAIEVARELGMSEEEITHGKEKIKPWLQIKKGINGLNIIDATYSANSNGVLSHLDCLKIREGRKVIVMPCLIELGSASKEVHQRIGKKIGEVCDLVIITTKECFENIKNSALKSGMKKENILFLEDPKKIFERIKEFDGKKDVILLESRVPKALINFLIEQ